MNWWARASLRTKIFWRSRRSILAVLLATLGLTQLVSEPGSEAHVGSRAADHRPGVRASDARARGAAADQLRAAGERLRAEARDGHAFRSRHIRRGDAGLGGRELSERMDVELMWITDETGVLLADVARAALQRGALASPRSRRSGSACRRKSAATGIAGDGRRAVSAGRRADACARRHRLSLLGHVIDDALAARLKADTGSDISFVTRARACSLRRGQAPCTRAARCRRRGAQAAARQRNASSLLTVGGERFLSLVVPIDARRCRSRCTRSCRARTTRRLRHCARLRWRDRGDRRAGAGRRAVDRHRARGRHHLGRCARSWRACSEVLERQSALSLAHRAAGRDRVSRAHRSTRWWAASRSVSTSRIRSGDSCRATWRRRCSTGACRSKASGARSASSSRTSAGSRRCSERLDPAALLRMLNRFFTEVVAAVEAEGGVVKQFTGDGVMALFGAPQSACGSRGARGARGACASCRASRTSTTR